MIPVVEKMEIFPVAGHDCMELNLSGAHAPYFTRNIVILTDSNGVEGVGEVPGGQKITAALEQVKNLVIGTSIADYKQTLNKVRKWLDENIKDDVRGLQTFDLRTGVHVVTAIEAPLLDLLGKFLDVPAALSFMLLTEPAVIRTGFFFPFGIYRRLCGQIFPPPGEIVCCIPFPDQSLKLSVNVTFLYQINSIFADTFPGLNHLHTLRTDALCLANCNQSSSIPRSVSISMTFV